MILTDEEIVGAVQGTGSTKLLMAIARRIEAAVLEKLRQQEPVYQLQCPDGSWVDQTKCSYEYNEEHGWPVRILYAAPVPATVPEGWRTLASDVLAYFDTPSHDFSAEQEQRLIVRLQALVSAAPAAPAVPANAAKDAERYRWLRDRLSIEDIDRIVSEFFGTPDEAESVKTDAAIDAAMQKGGATGAFLADQQYCFDKGWKEGAAAVHAAIRARGKA